MNKVLTLMHRDLLAWFSLPLGCATLAITQFLFAWQFLNGLDSYLEMMPQLIVAEGAPGVSDLVIAPFFAQSAFLLLILAPLVGMRAFAEERRQGSLNALLSAPVSALQLVLGKWLAVSAILLLMIALASVMALSLRLGTPLDMPKVLLGIAAMATLALALAALAVGCSALMAHPLAAAALALTLGLALWMLDQSARQHGVTDELINWLAIPTHLNPMLSGTLSTAALGYFACLTASALAIACWAMARQRSRPGL